MLCSLPSMRGVASILHAQAQAAAEAQAPCHKIPSNKPKALQAAFSPSLPTSNKLFSTHASAEIAKADNSSSPQPPYAITSSSSAVQPAPPISPPATPHNPNLAATTTPCSPSSSFGQSSPRRSRQHLKKPRFVEIENNPRIRSFRKLRTPTATLAK